MHWTVKKIIKLKNDGSLGIYFLYLWTTIELGYRFFVCQNSTCFPEESEEEEKMPLVFPLCTFKGTWLVTNYNMQQKASIVVQDVPQQSPAVLVGFRYSVSLLENKNSELCEICLRLWRKRRGKHDWAVYCTDDPAHSPLENRGTWAVWTQNL